MASFKLIIYKFLHFTGSSFVKSDQRYVQRFQFLTLKYSILSAGILNLLFI